MEFTEAIEIIKNIVPESSANEYDGIMVKRLEASNTLDEGRTTNQTHIAISGEQMNMFPYLMADGYFKCDYNDRDEQLKKYFITQIPLYIYKDNVLYLADGEESGISFGDEKSRCVRASIVRSRRKEQADQVQLSLTTIDDPAFVSFRRLLHTGDYLVILKHKEKLVYDCIGIKANDETRGEFNISALNNKFYKLPTNTKVDIKELIEIKNAEIENKKFTVDELGTILKEMYGNAEDKMQVASIHIFGIKYGKNIIENEFYIMIYDSNKDNIENELMKRANNWINRLKNCGYRSDLLYEREIIFLIKSFCLLHRNSTSFSTRKHMYVSA